MLKKFFRRHCVVAKILPNFEAVLFIDADIGVVNPKRRIEEYMDSNFDVVFYDRFYNWEITAGSYIVRNTSFAVKFLENFAKFETRLPESFHGTDNGGLHLYVAEVLYPSHPRIKKCEQVYQRSANYDDLFSFEACIRSILGPKTDFDRIRIMHKGTGWSRDNWLTNSLWNAERDFMIHGWKTNQYLRTPMDPGIIESSRGAWYNPLVGPIMLEKCSPSNSSWDYDPRLITPTSRIKKKLDDFEREIDKSQILSLARISKFL
ncbi:unnamed protein product [Caenorhabditis auriculariae]|uniref:Nucleotide-diphospho-sugar transferase domain-containing protein n=1 Tax=Caenorhabditis auriculariae TaxID=2777116 RepID=A0A8S1GUR1_9PELO|nr:unnamed protein product [Caenorhabditis auriculariae]